ncbi:MAG: HAMP domain-containing histidine kinase, partial [Clostridia bacterium]|nr:HAMP domain-containing histidine kinase [Clostridia bacterium]
MTLFLGLLQASTGLVYTRENITAAALFTFWNAVFLAFVCTMVDIIRRKISIERPVKRILEATERIMKGDFSVRIRPTRNPTSMNEFNPIIRDINKMTEELSGIETLRTDFIATVSHEIKTPLAALQNYGTLLEQPDLSEEKRKEYAKSIISITHHLSELITNILKLNKLENQKIYPALKKCNLSELICECLLSFESEWEKKELEIETDIDSDIIINTDSELLSLVCNNLFSNAVKFTDIGGRISVSLKNDGSFVVVKVTDTGCGMSEKTGKHIFEKFYQGDSSHSTAGNGLGLAL